MDEKLYKYSIVCEGKFDERLIQTFKNEILKIKTISYCKEHSICCKGCVKLKDVEKINNENCCKQFIVFDKDELSEKVIDEFRNKLKNKKMKKVIISFPSIEIILLAIFDVFEADYDKKIIEQKIKKHSDKIDIKYEHSDFDYLRKVTQWVTSSENKIDIWIDNIKKLDNLNKSNFIEIINFFKEAQNG